MLLKRAVPLQNTGINGHDIGREKKGKKEREIERKSERGKEGKRERGKEKSKKREKGEGKKNEQDQVIGKCDEEEAVLLWEEVQLHFQIFA